MDLGSLIGIGGKILDKVLPDPKVAAEAKFKLLELAQSGELAKLKADTDLALGQIEVNKIEAASGSVMGRTWRPAVGWVCVIALAYSFVLRPILSPFVAKFLGAPLEAVAMGELMVLLMGMLGLGGMRSFEKVQGVTR